MTASLLALLRRPAPEVAAELLGCRLSHETADGTVSIELTEVEAYAGERDAASHAFRGPTRRTDVMFGPPGRLYVYFAYGVHWCANIVTGPDGEASAVLLRAGRVVEGQELARARRGPRVANRSLARGPACLTQALGIAREQNGADLLETGGVSLDVRRSPGLEISRGPRVGISVAADLPWRFWVTGDNTVSSYKRSTRARRPSPILDSSD